MSKTNEIRSDLLNPWLEAIKTKGFYRLHCCSFCGYETGWGYFPDMPEGLVWDGGCYCVRYDGRRYVDTSELNFYLNPEHGHIKNIEKFIKGQP